MRNMVCVSTCAIWSKGKEDKKCGFYVDGRFKQEDFDNNVVYIIENIKKDHVLGVFENFELQNSEKNISICLEKELMRFQNHCDNNSRNIDIKLEDLCDAVNQTSNLIHSLEISSGKKHSSTINRAAACVLLCGKHISAVTCGQARAYLYSNGALKVLNEDLLKAERLIRAGIISNKQALDFEGKYVTYTDEIRRDIKKSSLYSIKEGDSVLLCNSDLLNVLDEDVLLSILSNHTSSSCALTTIVDKARQKGCDSELSIIICKVEKILSNYQCSECSMNNINIQHSTISGHTDASIKSKTNISSKKRKMLIKAALVVVSLLLMYEAFKAYDVAGFVKNFTQPVINAFLATGDKSGKGIGVIPPEISIPEPDINEESQNQKNHNDSLDNNNNDKDFEENKNPDDDMQNDNLPRKYIVKSGDTLEKISRQMYNDPAQYKKIMEANNIKSPERIQVGQELIIP